MSERHNMIRFGETEIIVVHGAAVRMYGGEFGIRDKDLFASVCESPYQEVFGMELYPTPYDKAAKYLFSFSNYQIFVDGNKRTGLGTAISYLEENGIELVMSAEEKYNLTLDIANHRYTEIADISAILRSHSIQMEKLNKDVNEDQISQEGREV